MKPTTDVVTSMDNWISRYTNRILELKGNNVPSWVIQFLNDIERETDEALQAGGSKYTFIYLNTQQTW